MKRENYITHIVVKDKLFLQAIWNLVFKIQLSCLYWGFSEDGSFWPGGHRVYTENEDNRRDKHSSFRHFGFWVAVLQSKAGNQIMSPLPFSSCRWFIHFVGCCRVFLSIHTSSGCCWPPTVSMTEVFRASSVCVHKNICQRTHKLFIVFLFFLLPGLHHEPSHHS